MVKDNVVVFTEDRVRALSGVTYRQLRYWAADLAPPAVDRQIARRGGVRLYDFDAALKVLILAELKRRGHSLQHLRQIAARISQRGLKFAELRFATSGNRVHFQTPDGEWEDADRPQHLDPEVVPLEPLRDNLRRSTQRDPATIGQIEKRRGALGSKELVAGTRVPTATVRRYLARGSSTSELLAAFPALTREDVEALQATA